MESKSLRNIQKFMKLGKVLSTIVSVFTVVGCVSCLVGAVCLFVFPPNQVVSLGTVTIHGIVGLEKEGNMNLPVCYTALLVGFIMCFFEFFLSLSAKKYFAHEIAAGTPFTMEGSRELLKLGIKAIVYPILSVTLVQVTYQVMIHYFAGITELNIDGNLGIGIGLFFIFFSFVCKYGSELESKNQ